MRRQVLISDLHLGAGNCRVEELEAFLLHTEFDELYVNGDVCDNLDFTRFKKKHWRVFNLLQDLDAVVLLGNHDRAKDGSAQLLKTFFGQSQDELALNFGDRRYLVKHGDSYDPLLHLPVLAEVAELVYQTSQKFSKRLSRWLKKQSKTMGGFLDVLLQRATTDARSRGFQGVILGHTHHAEDLQLHGLHYLNSGCWTGQDRPTYLLAVDDNVPQLHTFTG